MLIPKVTGIDHDLVIGRIKNLEYQLEEKETLNEALEQVIRSKLKAVLEYFFFNSSEKTKSGTGMAHRYEGMRRGLRKVTVGCMSGTLSCFNVLTMPYTRHTFSFPHPGLPVGDPK